MRPISKRVNLGAVNNHISRACKTATELGPIAIQNSRNGASWVLVDEREFAQRAALAADELRLLDAYRTSKQASSAYKELAAIVESVSIGG